MVLKTRLRHIGNGHKSTSALDFGRRLPFCAVLRSAKFPFCEFSAQKQGAFCAPFYHNTQS